MTIKAQYVYLFKSDKHFKVGRTENIQSRVKGLQTSSPFKIEIIDFFQTLNSVMDEKIIHQLLKDFKVMGEWFDIPAEFLEQKDTWFKSYVIECTAEVNIVDKTDNVNLSSLYEYEEFKKDCLSENGYLFLIESLSSSQLFSYRFIRENTELVLENAVKKEDDYMLLFCYKLLIDKSFEIRIDNFNVSFICFIQEIKYKQKTSYLAALVIAINRMLKCKTKINQDSLAKM